jgi:prephenate dehydrogenase
MTYQITIVGLGQIGGSVGLGLKEHKEKIRRVGHDRDPKVNQAALKMEAIDRGEFNLPRSVEQADLVLLCLPLDQIYDTLKVIARVLKEGCVVMDTGPAKEVVSNWAGELLPDRRHYVGLTPVLNPIYLEEHASGLEVAHADLFRNSLIAVSAPQQTSSEAIKLSADLVRLLGASPMFTDLHEIDGLMAATHVLPQLISAALVNATVDQPGWRDASKIAGRAYAEVTGPIAQLGDPKSLGTSVMQNRQNVLRVIDNIVATLQAMQEDIEQDNEEALMKRLERANKGREAWWSQRHSSNWQADNQPVPDLPKNRNVFGSLSAFGRRQDQNKK